MADFSDWESETKSEAKSDSFIKISPRLKPKEQSLNILIKRGIIKNIQNINTCRRDCHVF